MTRSFRRLFIAIWVAPVLLAAATLVYSSHARVSLEPAFTQAVCKDFFAQFTSQPGWFEQLVDPILYTPEEITQRLSEVEQFYDCLGREQEALSPDWVSLRRLSEYFLIFAGGRSTSPDQSVLILTSLKESNDPAIIKIRDQAGIPPPQGLVFVRLYASRAAMPEMIRQAFANEDVAGATYLSRYIAVVNEEKNFWPEEALQRQTLPRTISHELVHAYVNSILGLEGKDLPKWYHEGIAIYFSGSGESHTIITPDFRISTTPPKEYQEFKTNFDYLQAKLGREKLFERIRQSLEQANPALLYQDLGITSDQELANQASAWQQRRYSLRTGFFLLVAVLLVWGVTKFILDIRCPHCGYKGKREEFKYGYCPRCYRALDERNE